MKRKVWGRAKIAGHPAFTAEMRTTYASGRAPATSRPRSADLKVSW
jgi:hypothetical protein